MRLSWPIEGLPIRLSCRVSIFREVWLRIDPELIHDGTKPVTLNQLTFFVSTGQTCPFGDPQNLRVYTQDVYQGQVRWVREAMEEQSADLAKRTEDLCWESEAVWVAYQKENDAAFLGGFLASKRWSGRFRFAFTPTDRWQWDARFDLGDVPITPGQTLPLEPLVLRVDRDPWTLLESYGDLVAHEHGCSVPEQTPVTYCSWYPYRLNVSEETMLADARVAARRLVPLGLRVMQVDLGWQKNYLPNEIEENAQFSHGLKWLADQLEPLGLRLGVWWAPYSISEHSALAKEHPDWLIRGKNGEPLPNCTWYWAPHGRVFTLDLTHPDARAWLKASAESLAERGVKYLKADFIGHVRSGQARGRHDSGIVAGGGVEAARLGAQILLDALKARSSNALYLNCGGPDMPGLGRPDLLYACPDTVTWSTNADGGGPKCWAVAITGLMNLAAEGYSMLPNWLTALLVLLHEMWSVRRDVHNEPEFLRRESAAKAWLG